MEYEIGAVSTGAFKMKYIKFGSGEKILVILPGISIQSVTLSASSVAREYSRFASDFTVYLFDRREEVPDIYSIEDMANDTVQAMESLGLGSVYLYGVSQGGMIAFSIAAQRPYLVKKLAVCSTSIDVTGRTSVLDEWVSLAKSRDAAALFECFAKKIYPKRIFALLSSDIETASSSVTDAELERFAIIAEGTRGFDVSEKIPSIACPVFAAGSHDDEVLGGDAVDRIIEKMSCRPDFESVIFNGYGHAAYDLAPDFRDKLYDFFTKK